MSNLFTNLGPHLGIHKPETNGNTPLVKIADVPNGLSAPQVNLFGGNSSTLDVPVSDTDGPDLHEDRYGSFGVHSILKKTDYWFNMELSQLETFTITKAREHAEAGLPRQEAVAESEMPIEQKIRHDAAGLLIGWTERVRRKMEDGIQSAYVSAAQGLVQMRHTLDRLELTTENMRETEAALRKSEMGMLGKEKTVKYGSLLNRRTYPLIFGMLVVVDWVANVPVFGELLPQDPGAEQRWQDLVAGSERFGWTAGLHTLWDRLFFAPDVSLLAAGVVIFLMFLGHVCGKSLRRVVAFRAQDDPSLAIGLKSHHRQSSIPLALSSIGMICVIACLFFIRGQIGGTSQRRLIEATSEVNGLQSGLDAAKTAQDLDKVQVIQSQLDDAKSLVQERTKRANYAAGISASNGPILLLNIVLAITALTAAYLHDEAHIVETRLVDPRLSVLESRLHGFQEELLGHRHKLELLSIEVQESIARTKYLAQARPLRGSQSKIERLEGMVPLFRSENARMRGVDVRNILAFQEDRSLEYPLIDENETFQVPNSLPSLESEFSRIVQQLKPILARPAGFHIDGSNG